MSVTFWTPENKEGINLCNRNACDVLAFLGYEDGGFAGRLNAAELAERCRQALGLINAAPGLDPGKPDVQVARNAIDCGYEPGYLKMRIEQLLQLASGSQEVRYG